MKIFNAIVGVIGFGAIIPAIYSGAGDPARAGAGFSNVKSILWNYIKRPGHAFIRIHDNDATRAGAGA